MHVQGTLTQAAVKVGKLIDASDRVTVCANFIRKHRATDCEDVTVWVAEHDRLLIQLLEAQDALMLITSELK